MVLATWLMCPTSTGHDARKSTKREQRLSDSPTVSRVPTAAAATVTPTLPRVGRHYARRFSGGITPTLARQIIAAAGVGTTTSVRQQLEQHRADPTCASCHKRMDPLGFGLENFDAVGAWRTNEPGGEIDASAELPDGTKVDGVAALRDALVRRPEVFATTMTEKLLTYGLGRGLTYRDMPVVRGIVRQAAGRDYRFSSIVLGIVGSKPFQMKMIEDAVTGTRDEPERN